MPVPRLVTDVTWYVRVDARATVAFALITAAAFTLTAVPVEKCGVTDALPATGPFPPPASAVPANTPTASASATPAAGTCLRRVQQARNGLSAL